MNEKEIYQYLVQSGLTSVGTCSLMGNMQAESGLRANNAQNYMTTLTDKEYTAAADAGTIDFVYDSIGFGLCQWTYWSRKKALLDYAKKCGVSVGDTKMQLDFCLNEIKTRYSFVWNLLTTSNNIHEATSYVCTQYERPAVSNISTRENYAQKFYNQFASIDVPKVDVLPEDVPTVDVSSYPLIRRGSKGTYVKKCQNLLIQKGYELPKYGADGDFGAEMYSAVIKFQREHGLEVDGIVGAKTWEALFAAEDIGEEEIKPGSETKPEETKPEVTLEPTPSVGGAYDKQKVIKIALAEVGYLEKRTNSQLDDKTANAGYNNWNKYARDIDEKYPTFYNGKKNGYSWCDIFVDWCFIQAYGVDAAKKLLGQPDRSAGAGCQYSANYFRRMGQFYTSPQVGDQVFFGNYGNEGHTGLVVAVNGDIITTVEGNTSGGSGVDSNGGGVFKKQYNIKTQYIPGYGRPNYSDNSSGTTSTPTPVTPSGTDIKSNIKAFQTWLNTNYKTGISTDGVYGPLTKKAAIKAFQSYANATYKAGLVVDGDFGPKSKAAAQKCIISQGMKGAGVYIVQGLLYCNNINAGRFDGNFGSRMASAIKSYQTKKGLAADSIVGANTWNAFFR